MTTHTATPSLQLEPLKQGKVRQVYRVPDEGQGDRVAIVASDRISAFDVVLPTPIPGKGKVLTEIAAWWFRWLAERRLVETHLISTSLDDLPPGSVSPEDRESLDGRVTIARACRVIPIEFVVRGYVEGSGWKDYQETGSICGHKLPAGLTRCDRLPEPIFTPATKAESGHDENITFEEACDIAGLETMGVLRDVSLRIYKEAAAYALERGIIIADTKFEFGIPDDSEVRSGRVWNQPILIDEALTPDSSRFWPADDYEPGRAQASFDKQYVRDFLEEVVSKGEWDKTPPGPDLPRDVVDGTLARYREVAERLAS